MHTALIRLSVFVAAATLVLTHLALVGTAKPAAAAATSAGPGDVVDPDDGIAGVEPVEPEPCRPPGEPAPACEAADPPLPGRPEVSTAPPADPVADPGAGEDQPDDAASPDAGARGPVGGVTGPSTGTNAPLSGPGANAPTNNLAWVGQAIATRTKSTTVVVEIPAGIPVTGPVAINVRFGGRVVDQDYVAATGNRILHNYGVGGPARQETVNVRLTDRAAGVSYAMDLKITIEPLYDVTVGPLYFEETSDCDLGSEADPDISWMNAQGRVGYAEPDVLGGTARVDNFADTFYEVAVADGLIVPQIYWEDWDPALFPKFEAYFFGLGDPLLPTTSRTLSWIQDDFRGRCNAAFSYDLTVQLRWYPNL